MKRSKAQSKNYANIDVDNYRMLLISKGFQLEDNLHNLLEIKFSNTKYKYLENLWIKKNK